MNEAETRAELIDPALKAAGWGVVSGSRIRRESITLGCLQPGNIRAKQNFGVWGFRGLCQNIPASC
jgi:type I restriction enzyme R subunit